MVSNIIGLRMAMCMSNKDENIDSKAILIRNKHDHGQIS